MESEELKKLGFDEKSIESIEKYQKETGKPFNINNVHKEIITPPQIQQLSPEEIESQKNIQEDGRLKNINSLEYPSLKVYEVLDKTPPFSQKNFDRRRVWDEVGVIGHIKLIKKLRMREFQEIKGKEFDKPFNVKEEYEDILREEKENEIKEIKKDRLKQEKESHEQMKQLEEKQKILYRFMEEQEDAKKKSQDMEGYLKERILKIEKRYQIIHQKMQSFYPTFQGMDGEHEFIDLKEEQNFLFNEKRKCEQEIINSIQKKKLFEEQKKLEFEILISSKDDGNYKNALRERKEIVKQLEKIKTRKRNKIYHLFTNNQSPLSSPLKICPS